MLSKAQIKLIHSLSNARDRAASNLFIVEGVKMVDELLHSDLEISQVFATRDWEPNQQIRPVQVQVIENFELDKISSLTTPNKVLAVAQIPAEKPIRNLKDELVLLLDRINDPGNMGTIIRTAEWFGIHRVIASNDSVDFMNPKVVQSSMGSIFRMPVNSVDILDFLHGINNIPIYGTLFDGKPVGATKLTANGIIVVGNESHGISDGVKKYITDKLTIPAAKTSGSESLNASIATAIVCYEFRRQFPR